MRSGFTLICALVAGAACGGGSGTRTVIQNKGSDTLVNVAQAWAERYREVRPDVAIAVTGGGSGTGLSALINGTVDIASSSRRIGVDETEAARSRGIEPVEHVVGYDALAVFLHPDNPIRDLEFEQLAAIYGEGGGIEAWGQLGVSVPGCRSGEIVLVSRQNNSGTYEYFREAVLGEREYAFGSRDMHGSKDVVDLVARTPCAIGYSGLAYATDQVAMPCIRARPDAECVVPSPQSAVDGSYPISRPLFMYTPGPPEGAVADYLDWILSDAGQCVIAEKGYAPVREVSCPTAMEPAA